MIRTATWTLSLLAGAITLVVLSLHMGFVKVNYVVLLAVALYHGFYGLHLMLTEYWPSRRASLLIAGACITTGGGLFVLAAVTSVVF